MARTVRDANLESRAARARLLARKKPYYRTIDRGAHLSYYKGAQSASWGARYFIGTGRYAETRLGKADDVTDADGVAILSFGQAQASARAWFTEQARRSAGIEPVVETTVCASRIGPRMDSMMYRPCTPMSRNG